MNSSTREKAYSGKKKRCALNNILVTNNSKVIIHIGRPHPGSTHDMTIMKHDALPILEIE